MTAIAHDPDGKIAFTLGVVEDITERKRAEEALQRERRTLKHMLEASDHERQLISYDIHDGLAQELAGAIMQFQIYAHARQANPKDAAKAFDAGMTMLQQSHVEARRLISGVRPPILDESGVVAAIAHLVYDPAFDQGPKIDFRNRVTFKRLGPGHGKRDLPHCPGGLDQRPQSQPEQEDPGELEAAGRPLADRDPGLGCRVRPEDSPRKITLGWKAFVSVPGCWEASVASRARRAKVPVSWSSCPWW